MLSVRAPVLRSPALATVWWLVVVAACVGIAVAATSSAKAGGALLFLMIVAISLVWLRSPKTLAIVALMSLATIDISKAIVPPNTQFFSPGYYMSPAHLVAILLAIGWAGRRLIVERRGLPFTRLDLLAFLWCAIIWARSFGSPQGTLALASAFSYTMAIVVFYVVSHALETEREIKLALMVTAGMLFFELAYVGAQMVSGNLLPLPGSKNLFPASTLTFGGEGFAFRPIGVQAHPNALAHRMALFMAPALAVVVGGVRLVSKKTWWLAVACLMATVIVMLLSMARTSWAASILAGLVLGIVLLKRGFLPARRAAAVALLCGFGVVIAIAVYPQILLRLTASDDRSTESRLLLVDQAMAMIKANPLVGVGYGGYNRASFEYIGERYATVSPEYQKELHYVVVHNHYLLLAAELGVPAMLFFVWVLWKIIRLPWTTVRRWRDRSTQLLAYGFSASMVGQMLYLSGDNFYADNRVFLIWMTAGLLQALCLQAARDQQDPA